MKTSLYLEQRLPFVQLRIWYKGQNLLLDKVLVDTGSASTIIKLDVVENIGIVAEKEDVLGSISGVGGSEFIFLKTIDSVEMNGIHIKDFTVDVGIMDYGIDIDGIVGMDFLLKIKGIINLDELIIESSFK